MGKEEFNRQPFQEQSDAGGSEGIPSNKENPLQNSEAATKEKHKHRPKKRRHENNDFCFNGGPRLPQSWIEEEEERRNQILQSLQNNSDQEPENSS
jgi:hypothetical protein